MTLIVCNIGMKKMKEQKHQIKQLINLLYLLLVIVMLGWNTFTYIINLAYINVPMPLKTTAKQLKQSRSILRTLPSMQNGVFWKNS